MTTARQTLDRQMAEADMQAAVIELARRTGWRVYHTYDSRRSAPGFPDLVLCRPPELLFVELKTERGKLSLEQQEWLDRLWKSEQEAYVWRPYHWSSGEIERRLRRRVVP